MSRAMPALILEILLVLGVIGFISPFAHSLPLVLLPGDSLTTSLYEAHPCTLGLESWMVSCHTRHDEKVWVAVC